MDAKVISYTTPDPVYTRCAERFMSRCITLNLDYDVIIMGDCGDRRSNCLQKCTVYGNMMEKHNCPLLWIDVDDLIIRNPISDEFFNYDVCLHLKKQHKEDIYARYSGGVVFINNTERGKKFAQLCKSLVSINPFCYDEQITYLASTIIDGLTIGSIPDTYFDRVRTSNTIVQSGRMRPFWVAHGLPLYHPSGNIAAKAVKG